MRHRRSLSIIAFVAFAAAGAVLAPSASAAPAAPASVATVQAVSAPAAAQVTAHRALYASTGPVVAMQLVLGVDADGIWGPVTDRAAWAFESKVYMQWPNQAAKVAAMQRAFNLDNSSPDIKVDGAWGAQTEYKFRGLRSKYYEP